MKALGWAWFCIVQLIEAIFLLIGLLLLIPMAYFKLWVLKPSPYFPGRIVTVWRGGWLMFPLGNWEDGCTGEASTQRAAEYASRYPDIRLRAYMWSALRNPANNLRFIFRWR